MTRFNETNAAETFIATAASRNTSPEIMAAIAFFARNETEAEALWNGDALGTVARVIDIYENATENGRIDPECLFWGDRSLAQVIVEWDEVEAKLKGRPA